MGMAVRKENEDDGAEREKMSSKQRLLTVAMLVMFLSVFLFAWIGGIAEQENPVDVRTKATAEDAFDSQGSKVVVEKDDSAVVVEKDDGDGAGAQNIKNVCLDVCQARRTTRKDQFGGDLLDRKDLLEALNKAKANMISKLHVDYGKEHFENIFVDKAANGTEQRFRGFDPITPDGDSPNRLKRKLLIKILSMQTAIQTKESNVRGCDCINGDQPLGGPARIENDDDAPLDKIFERYIWATGGHSAAAGHGNLYNESYTAFMERDLKPIFGAIGIEFEGRNYAMGGTNSGPEISMCSEQVFGSDVDFVSWDFGMTDGDRTHRLLHFFYRAALAPGRAATLMTHNGGRNAKMRQDAQKELEKMGLTVFTGFLDTGGAMYDAIPSTDGMTFTELSQLPEYVRNFKCEGKIESGDPFCTTEKFSKAICSPRSKQSAWHPGIKLHAMDGHVLALFLVQALVDAVKDLVEDDTKDPEMLLAQFKGEEDQLHSEIVKADLPKRAISFNEGKEKHPDSVELASLFFKGSSICRTARTPAQARYLGYVTNSGKVGSFAPVGNETYDTGIERPAADESDANGVMRLVYDHNAKERMYGCPVVVKPDYKDYFYAHTRDGLVKMMTFPNNAEKAAYRFGQSEYKGLIVLHFTVCDWGKCPADMMRYTNYEAGSFEVTVNGKSVKSMFDYGSGAIILEGDDGYYWKPSGNGDYEISFHVKDPESYLTISAVVLY